MLESSGLQYFLCLCSYWGFISIDNSVCSFSCAATIARMLQAFLFLQLFKLHTTE